MIQANTRRAGRLMRLRYASDLTDAEWVSVEPIITGQARRVTHLTDAKLMLRAIEKLGALAKAEGLKLRQSYARLAKRAAQMAQRYVHAKQFKRANRSAAWDITRKIAGNSQLEAIFA